MLVCGRKFQLHKRVSDVIVLVGIFSPSVGLKVKTAEAEGRFLIDSREHTFTRVGVILAGEAVV